jgi:hypothetical protein
VRAGRTATIALVRRSSIALIVLALLVVGAGAWWLFWPRARLPANPLAAIPADAYGMARIKVGRVIASEAYKRLVVEQGGAHGVERVQALCGFDPLARVSELYLFARPAPDRGVPRVAFVARGDLRHAELLDCVKKITGGDASALQREDVEGIPAFRSKQGSSLAAFVGRDGVVGGDAESVRAALHSVLGQAPSLAENGQLAALYRELEQGADITLVTRWPEEVRPWLRSLAELTDPSLLKLAQLRALGLNVTTFAGRIGGGALLLAPSPAAASEFVTLGQQGVARLLAIPGIGLTPAASVLRGMQMEARGDRATFTGNIKVSTIEALLAFAPALEAAERVQRTLQPAGAASARDAGP